jgi:hypothetical protein
MAVDVKALYTYLKRSSLGMAFSLRYASAEDWWRFVLVSDL